MGGKLGREGGAAKDRKEHEKTAGGFAEGMAFIPELVRGAVKALGTPGDRAGGAGVLMAAALPVAAAAGAGFALGRFGHKPLSAQSPEKLAEAFKLALEETGMSLESQNLPAPKAQPQGIEPQLDPATQQMLAMQQAGDQAAGQNEAAFLRQKLQEVQQAQQAAQEQAMTAQQEAEQLQQAQAMHDQQTQQYQAQVADSTQKAMAAQDQVLQQQQAAAAMRMAFQQLRGTLLQAASTEPPSITPGATTAPGDQAAAAASQAAGASSAPTPSTGPAGAAPSPGTAPGVPGPMGEETVSAPSAGNEPMFGNAQPTTSVGQQEQTGDAKTPGKEVLSHYLPFAKEAVSADWVFKKTTDAAKKLPKKDLLERASSLREMLGSAHAPGPGHWGKYDAMADALENVSHMKKASLRDYFAAHAGQLKAVLPHAAVGAGIGAGIGAGESFTSNEPLKKKVQELEAKPDRGYGDALNLAQARARLTVGEFAKEHPAAMMGMGALGGGLTGALEGPDFVDSVRRSGKHISGVAKNVKDIYNKGAA